MTILAELYALPWAVRPEVLTAVLGYVERKDTTPEMLARAFHFDPAVQEAAAKQRWNRYAVHQQTSVLVDGSQALYRRGRTAILPITGPIIRRGNLMSSLSGGPMTSVEMLAKDFSRALEDDSFTSILLDVDSPGGEASGISELAAIIAAARDQKPITAYVGDMAASAAYWLASAASEIVVNKTAALGSIGVVMAVPDPKATEQRHVEFVSSASPQKRPDPNTKAGKSQLQELVDVLGDLFVEDVATNRNVGRETVLTEFGAGGLRVGADAVERGMADRLGSFEEVLASLTTGETSPERAEPAATRPLRIAPEDRPRSPAAPPAALTPGAPTLSALAEAGLGDGGEMSSLLDNLRTLVATAEAPASADREASILASGLTVDGAPPAAPPPPPAASRPSSISNEAEMTLQTRLVAAEAENARLRFAQIQARAQGFARSQTDALRAFAPEVAHLVALYCVLASDDETHGPLQGSQGKSTTRISYLENLLASRPSRTELTEDVFGDTVAQVLTERSRPKVDPNAPASEAQLAAYLEQTSVGRATLARIAGKGV